MIYREFLTLDHPTAETAKGMRFGRQVLIVLVLELLEEVVDDSETLARRKLCGKVRLSG